MKAELGSWSVLDLTRRQSDASAAARSLGYQELIGPKHPNHVRRHIVAFNAANGHVPPFAGQVCFRLFSRPISGSGARGRGGSFSGGLSTLSTCHRLVREYEHRHYLLLPKYLTSLELIWLGRACVENDVYQQPASVCDRTDMRRARTGVRPPSYQSRHASE